MKNDKKRKPTKKTSGKNGQLAKKAKAASIEYWKYKKRNPNGKKKFITFVKEQY